MTKMLSELAEKWAEVFSVIGSEERLTILLVLQGSTYVRHRHTESDVDMSVGSLSFSQIAESADISSSTRLSYHLSKLMEAGLVMKLPFIDTRGRVFPLYTITSTWKEFSSELGIDKIVKSLIHKRYPEAYREPE